MNYGPKLNPRTENKTKKRRGRIKKIIKHGGAVGKRIEIGGRRGASRKWSPLQLFRRAASVYGTRSGTQSKSRQKVAIKSLFPVWRWHFAGNFASDAFSPWPPVTCFFFFFLFGPHPLVLQDHCLGSFSIMALGSFVLPAAPPSFISNVLKRLSK